MIETLDPSIQEPARLFVGKLEATTFKYTILETRRSAARQAALWAQGREPMERINALRALSGFGPLAKDEAGRIVTWARHSKHQDGLALDIAPLLANGRIPWVVRDRATADLWLQLGELGESCGFAWGGRWPKIDAWGLGKDLPHFEKQEQA
jgi:hypothetical protein